VRRKYVLTSFVVKYCECLLLRALFCYPRFAPPVDCLQILVSGTTLMCWVWCISACAVNCKLCVYVRCQEPSSHQYAPNCRMLYRSAEACQSPSSCSVYYLYLYLLHLTNSLIFSPGNYTKFCWEWLLYGESSFTLCNTRRLSSRKMALLLLVVHVCETLLTS